MELNNKQKFSYFTLKLETFLSEHHPDKMSDKNFIKAREDMALTAYCDAIAQGFNHIEAESISSEVLYRGLHFSPYDTLVSVLENEFEKEYPSPLPERLAPLFLKNKAIQSVFAKYDIDDDFSEDHLRYKELYTELTGTIVIVMEANHLPTVEQNEG